MSGCAWFSSQRLSNGYSEVLDMPQTQTFVCVLFCPSPPELFDTLAECGRASSYYMKCSFDLSSSSMSSAPSSLLSVLLTEQVAQ